MTSQLVGGTPTTKEYISVHTLLLPLEQKVGLHLAVIVIFLTSKVSEVPSRDWDGSVIVGKGLVSVVKT